MKHIIAYLLTGLVFCNSGFSRPTDTIPANDSRIEYTGRIDFINPLAPKFSYSGVSIRANFIGKNISAIMDDNLGQNYYNIILDDSIITILKIKQGKREYTLASDLKDTIHEIEIFKRTEEMFGKTTFYGFVPDATGSLVELTQKRTRLIEFIGNSITCGYGNEGINGGKFGASTENYYMTYAAITSRHYNARNLAVCKSGIGIYRNYAGPSSGNWDCMPRYYPRIFLYDSLPVYDFRQRPDLICIDLGTNDFNTHGGDSARFVSEYLKFIDTLQTKYTNPDIIVLLGPMLFGTDLIMVRKYLQFIADSANKKRNGKVYFFEMSQQTGDLGMGIDYHPTVAQHKKNAMELTNYISKLKGWNKTINTRD
jgi:hypothetical protein